MFHCCVKDSRRLTQNEVSRFHGLAEGAAAPVLKLRNPGHPVTSAQVAADEGPVPQNISSSDKDVTMKSSPAPSTNDFMRIKGAWFFAESDTEAGTIASDGHLTFHNGMTGQLSKVTGRSQEFTLTTQPEATIEIVRGAQGEDQLKWSDGDFVALWKRVEFAAYAGIWVRKLDGMNMIEIKGSGRVEWIHDGGPVNPRQHGGGRRRSSLFSTTSDVISEVRPGSVFQLQALPQTGPRGETIFTMTSATDDSGFTVVAPKKTELKFQTSTLQGLVLEKKTGGL